MIRNLDLVKEVPVSVILEVMEHYFPETLEVQYLNPEGFGKHYVQDETVINTEEITQRMIDLAEVTH